MRTEGDLKFVGVTHTLSRFGKPNAQFIETMDYVGKVCNLLTRKKANALSKVTALRQHVYNKVAYTAKLSSYSLSATRSLDGPVNKLLNNITKNMPSAPMLLKYADTKDFGLGLPRLSDFCAGSKWITAHQTELGDEVTSYSVSGLLMRAARSNGMEPLPGQKTLIYHNNENPTAEIGDRAGKKSKAAVDKSTNLWAGSLLEWLDNYDHCVMRGGYDSTGTPDEQICSPRLRQLLETSVVNRLVQLGIHTIGDLFTDKNPGGVIEIDDCNLNEFLSKVTALGGLSPTVYGDPLTLRRNYCWVTEQSDTVYEFLGWEISEKVRTRYSTAHVREWTVHKKKGGVTRYTIKGQAISLGAGCNFIVPIGRLLPKGRVDRVFMNNNKKTTHKKETIVTRTIDSI